MPSPPSAGTPVRLLPFEPSPFAVWLLRRPAGDRQEKAGDPFQPAGLEPGSCRTYVALLRSETGAVLDRLVLKLPGDERDDAPFPGEEPLSNRALEEEWAAAHRDLLKLLAAPASFPELVLPAAGEDGVPLLPPLLFCPAADRLFRIPCPRCFEPLRTCRDDALLAAAGLPLYTATSARFLTCPACGGGKSGEPRFWAGTAQEARGLGDGVGDLDELRRELTEALGRGGRPAGVPETPVSGWTVFNLHDAPYFLTRLAPVPFETFIERLGGAPEESPGGDPAEGSGFLFGAEGSGVDAVEVLALKLAAFLQAVSALRQHYLLLGRPHLDLHPGHLAVEPGPRGDLLPHLWSFQVKLLGGSPGRVVRLGPEAEAVLPPRTPRMPFAAPAVRAARLAAPSAGEFLIERVVAEKGQDLWRIEGALLDPHGFYPPPASRDWIQLAWPRDFLGDVRTALARLDPRATPESVEIAITTEPLALDPALARRLGRAGFRVPGVRYRIYPALSVPEDLWSLGVLLLRLLLVNDGQGLAALEPLLEAVPRGAGPERRSLARTVEETLSSLLTAEPQKLAKANLFHQAVDRDSSRPNAVPDDLWTGSLLLAFRLLARDPAFGLSAESTGSFAWDEAHPAGHLDAVRAQAEDLLRQLYTVLFQRQTVNAEIHAVIAELLAEEAGGGSKRGPTDRMG